MVSMPNYLNKLTGHRNHRLGCQSSLVRLGEIEASLFEIIQNKIINKKRTKCFPFKTISVQGKKKL